MRAEMRHGGVAQLARAFGSYPECHPFKSDRRYHERTVILIESYRSFSLPEKCLFIGVSWPLGCKMKPPQRNGEAVFMRLRTFKT